MTQVSPLFAQKTSAKNLEIIAYKSSQAIMVGTTQIIAEKGISAHVEETLGKGAIEEAKFASQAEHEATLWQSIKTHRKAVFWSAIISMSIVMEGYVWQ